MEKIIYTLWRKPELSARTFRERLCSEIAPALVALGARGVRVSVVDEAVSAGEGLRITANAPLIDGMLSLWVDSAITLRRAPLDTLIRTATQNLGAYLVTESQVLVNSTHAPDADGRTPGFTQLAFLRRPARLSREHWLDIWQNHHTQVAIDTQDTFEYIQNLVVHPLLPDSLPVDAIVEEGFPLAAMTDRYAYFDAAGDEARFKRHLDIMMESCARFIDFNELDVLIASQYPLSQPVR